VTRRTWHPFTVDNQFRAAAVPNSRSVAAVLLGGDLRQLALA
jgi:hypothetical protein